MKDTTILIIVAVVVVGFILYQQGVFNITDPLTWPFSINNYYNQTQQGQQQSNSQAPTTLMVVVEPNPVTMGNRIAGAVTGDGYRTTITVHAKHKGTNTEQTFNGLLDDQGRFIHAQTINVPGSWSFWATAGSVISNTVTETVQGVAVSADKESVSKSLNPTCIVSVFSDHSGNAQVFADDPAHGVSIPLTNCVVNAGGFGQVQVDFSSFAQGTYQINAVVGGETADSYGGTWAITVGR